MELKNLTPPERSLLTYLETRCVDYGGTVNMRHMNEDDRASVKKWAAEGFIRFGRLSSDYLPRHDGSTSWVELSEAAWSLAHAERRQRYHRINEVRAWATTGEARA